MNNLFPEIEPYKIERLKVSSLHEIHLEQSGNPDGQPILFLHGGPGGATDAKHRRYFDPKHYRIILFDQRGCGKSTPRAEIQENTTWDLVHDIELIRKHLGIRKWIVFGGSWGSTLALSYSIRHSGRVLGLILRGIFLCRKEEIQWFYQEGASKIFPDIWESYLAPIPEDERTDLVAAYHKRLTSNNKQEQLEAAKAWSKWEGATCRMFLDEEIIASFDDNEHALEFARIENHYFTNNAFFDEDNFILNNIQHIQQIPGVIIHGRYDIVCPVKNAWDLAKVWNGAQLHIVQDSGHSASEGGITQKLLEATEAFKAIPIDS
ncbi:MAG: prolyl aminopeptidase [Oligoflexia bacterium]|nr:prolyl aminopeptidase [Oligoflexia bacterium]